MSAPCNCGRRATRVETLRTLRSFPTRSGGYLLGTYPDCTDLHKGAWAGYNIYVVGRNTEFERLFKRTLLAEASAYARETRQAIENLPTQALCDQAVLDVYAG